MGKRRKARESTLQILFQIEFDSSSLEKILDSYWETRAHSEEVKSYSTWLIEGILSHKDEIDRIIQSVSEHWRVPRMAIIDRNILRMAVFELLYEENVVPAIVINEAIEIAKKYSGEQAGTFVNGILDAIRKQLPKIKSSLKENEND
ncbi:MAG: transcription antitermination factor NusB [Candidatus Aminicenantes bacterium]|nr:transcription antitermination factor NusB [Candidatus Aminicenantes bacterium]